MNKLRGIGLVLWMSAVSGVYAANPATKEYVDQQDNNLQTQINNIPVGTTYTAGSGIDITGGVISITGGGSGFYVGQLYQGGVIYWLDPTSSPSIHGLIANIADQPTTLTWQSNNTVATGATLDGAYQGQDSGTYNTAKIRATPGATYPAASACATSAAQGFTDWYLPSTQELYAMFVNQMAITQTALANSGSTFARTSYWSSTEVLIDNARLVNFSSGGVSTTTKNNVFQVRCVRAY